MKNMGSKGNGTTESPKAAGKEAKSSMPSKSYPKAGSSAAHKAMKNTPKSMPMGAGVGVKMSKGNYC